MHDYYYRDKAGREIGPVRLDALAKLRFAGVLSGDTPIREAQSAEWKQCREIISDTPVTPSATVQAPAMPAQLRPKLAKMKVVTVAALAVVAATGFLGWRWWEQHRWEYAERAELAKHYPLPINVNGKWGFID